MAAAITARTIFITGVSRGLGRALTTELISAGHTVIGCARGAAAINELNQRYGAPHRFAVVDVTDAAAVDRWIIESFPQDAAATTLLINNAGVINANANLWEVTLEEFRHVIDVNLLGQFHTIRSIVPLMMAAGGGGIINVSSTWGSTTAPEVAPYCASKWAVEGLTQALGQELPPPLFAVAVNPGVIHTDMLESCFGDAAGTYPTPETWAVSAMPFLLSLSRQHSGQTVRVPI